jgi:hypothetical protein
MGRGKGLVEKGSIVWRTYINIPFKRRTVNATNENWFVCCTIIDSVPCHIKRVHYACIALSYFLYCKYWHTKAKE